MKRTEYVVIIDYSDPWFGQLGEVYVTPDTTRLYIRLVDSIKFGKEVLKKNVKTFTSRKVARKFSKDVINFKVMI